MKKCSRLRGLAFALFAAMAQGCGTGSTDSSPADSGRPSADAEATNSGAGLSGTLGSLGPIQPIVSGWATTNGPETLIYLTTADLTCADMMTMGVHWLSKLPAKSQVIEIVIPGAATAKTYPVARLQAEVNYAEGSKSSSSEVVGKAGSVTFSKVANKQLYEGTLTVSSPFTATGAFHAEWCEGGAEF